MLHFSQACVRSVRCVGEFYHCVRVIHWLGCVVGSYEAIREGHP